MPNYPMPLIEKIIMSPLNCLWTFVKNQLSIYIQLYFWTLFHFNNLFVCLTPMLQYLDYCNFIMSWSQGVSLLKFLFVKVIVILGTLNFHMNLNINLLISPLQKRILEFFITITESLEVNLTILDILHILSLLNMNILSLFIWVFFNVTQQYFI